MAFVYEVERPTLFPINKDTAEIGPGQYLPLNSYKFYKPNSIPFGISTKRQFPFSLNNVPGPGSYNPKEEQNILNPKLLKEKKEIKEKNNKKGGKLMKMNKIKIINKKNLESEKFQNKENLGFFTKVQRFKLKIQKDTPGPGSYDDKNILLAKSIEEKCNNKKELVYKINTNRHDIYYVNRNNNQFPWNAEVIITKKESKKQKRNKYNLNLIKNEKENIIINNATINNINTKEKSKKIKNPTKERDKKEDENNMFLSYSDLKNNKNNKIKENTNICNKKSIKKSKTSYNFYLPDTGVKIYYSKLSKKEIKQKLEEEMVKRKIQNDIKYRVSSIPSKFSAGYEIEKESGKVVRRPIKTYFKIFSGEKNDAVGPGSYEINLPEIWRKTGTCWSKYLCEKEPLKKRPKSGNDINENKLINHNKIDKCYIKIAKKKINNEKIEKKNNLNINLFRTYTSKQIMFRDPTSQKIRELSEEINKKDMPIFIHINNVPGPGYYYDEEEKKIESGKKIKNSLKEVKKFNRFEENFRKINSDNKNGLGPGTYFNDILNLYSNQNQNKTEKSFFSKQKTKGAPFLSKSKRFIYDKPLNLFDNINKNNKESKVSNDDFTKIIYNSNSIESSQTSNSTHKLGLFKKEDSQNEFINEHQIKNKNIKIKQKSISGTFYRKDIRFRENIQEENMKKYIPGPGSYINPYTSTGKSNSVKIDDRYMDIRSCRLIIEKNRFNKYYKKKKNEKNKIFWLGETDEIKPCVGIYDPDKTMTILYEINKNKKYGNKAFNSTQYSNRSGFDIMEKNIPIGPGCYYKDKFVEEKQINAAFNSTADRFYKGGKNNTKNFHKVPKRSLSVLIKRDNKTNKDGNISNELILKLKAKIIKEKKDIDLGMFNYTNTPYIVGPGTYNFLPEIYPWIKQTYNVKFI